MRNTLEVLAEVFGRYLDLWGRDGLRMLGVAALVFALAALVVRRRFLGQEASRLNRWLPRLLMAAFLAVGLWMALGHASLEDDAFISFRYARNLVDGHGLVFNIGERVEGYTNFLWTALIALGLWLTPLSAPGVALILGPACFALNLLVIYRIGRLLAAKHRPGLYIPVAALLLAVQIDFTAFATTGMETMMASLFVDLGVLFLLSGEGLRGAALSGSMFILSTFTRPDHSLFYIAGGIALLIREGSTQTARESDRWFFVGRAGLGRLAAYAAPAGAYFLYLLWKMSYYGSLMPNTYYAKSVEGYYFSQGVVYLLSFLLGSHFWIVAILFVLWLFLRQPGNTTSSGLKAFSTSALLLYNLYVLKVGGDYAYGRFYLVCMPLLLLGAEDLFYFQLKRFSAKSAKATRLWVCIIAFALALTAPGGRMIEPGKTRWFISSVWMEVNVNLLKHHSNLGAEICRSNTWKTLFFDRGIHPVLGETGIGQTGYCAPFPVIVDLHGLTDPVIARAPLPFGRGYTGHEKWPTRDYLLRRGVHFTAELFHPAIYRDLTRIAIREKTFYIFIYDRDLMNRIKKEVPEIAFVDFEQYLDQYIADLANKPPYVIQRDLSWSKTYYFDHNEDPARLNALTSFVSDAAP